MKKQQLLVSLPWLLLDFAGILFVLFAGMEYMKWISIWPITWQFPYYELIIMMIGFFMMTPYQVLLLMAIMKRIQQIKKDQK